MYSMKSQMFLSLIFSVYVTDVIIFPYSSPIFCTFSHPLLCTYVYTLDLVIFLYSVYLIALTLCYLSLSFT